MVHIDDRLGAISSTGLSSLIVFGSTRIIRILVIPLQKITCPGGEYRKERESCTYCSNKW